MEKGGCHEAEAVFGRADRFALRQTENGIAVDEVCRKLGVSEATFYRWKKQFAGMGVVEIRRLKQLEEENTKAQAADGGSEPRQGDVAGRAEKKVLRPAVRREVVCHLRVIYQISERRACHATGFGRSSQRYKSRRDPQVASRIRLKDLAAVRVRYGYRRLHVLLRREVGR